MRLASRTTILVFSLTLLFGVGHFTGVALTAMRRGVLIYDFRFYSMLLVGGLMIAPSVVGLRQVPGIRRGEAGAWRTAQASSLVLLAANLPMLPMQRAQAFVAFGALVSALAAIHWLTLAVCRKRDAVAEE